jgi:hypothetical protein
VASGSEIVVRAFGRRQRLIRPAGLVLDEEKAQLDNLLTELVTAAAPRLIAVSGR